MDTFDVDRFLREVDVHVTELADSTFPEDNARLIRVLLETYEAGLLQRAVAAPAMQMFSFGPVDVGMRMLDLLEQREDDVAGLVFMRSFCENFRVQDNLIVRLALHRWCDVQAAKVLLTKRPGQHRVDQQATADVLLSRSYGPELLRDVSAPGIAFYHEGLAGLGQWEHGKMMEVWDHHADVEHEDWVRFLYMQVAQNVTATPDMLDRVASHDLCTPATAQFLMDNPVTPEDVWVKLGFRFPAETLDHPNCPEQLRAVVSAAV